MERRVFISGAAALLATPLAAEAQQAVRTARIGNLTVGPQPTPGEIARRSATSPLLIALKELGWVEGQNMIVERRFGESAEQVRVAAADLVQLKVDVVIAWSTSLAKLVQMETNTIPIVVIGAGVDLVAAGLVTSLAKPGGNLTGLQILSEDLVSKRFELLQAVVPSLTRVALLRDNVTAWAVPEASARYLHQATMSARTFRMELHPVTVLRSEDLPTAFRGVAKNGDKGLVVAASPFMFTHRKEIGNLALAHRMPAIHEYREYLDAGGLISYGVNVPDLQRRCAVYVDKILKGAKPADLPVEQPTKFELVINLKTAKALGLTIPQSLLQRADQVIE